MNGAFMHKTLNGINRWHLRDSIFICMMLLFAACASNWQLNTASKSGLDGGSTTSGRSTISTSLISRNVPAFSSSSFSPASYANDESYDTSWRSRGTPAWLAYDLSGVSASHRNKLLLVWYNESFNYDHTIINTYSYNTPEN